jgi:hypothetical protein
MSFGVSDKGIVGSITERIRSDREIVGKYRSSSIIEEYQKLTESILLDHPLSTTIITINIVSSYCMVIDNPVHITQVQLTSLYCLRS